MKQLKKQQPVKKTVAKRMVKASPVVKHFNKTFYMPVSPDSDTSRIATTLPLFRKLSDAKEEATKKYKGLPVKVTISW